MDRHQAVLKAQELVKLPQKDKLNNEWYVEYRNNNHWVRKTFITDEGAYMFYYSKLREFKDAIITMQMKDRSK